MDLSDQVIRYDSKEQYIEYTNHMRDLCKGELQEDFPDWGEDGPDAYWKVWYERMEADPEQILEMWTLLVDEDINEDGSLERQHVRYETVRYPNREACLASRYFVDQNRLPDPGVPVSNEFTSLRQAERMRRLLMQGEPGYYYTIKHKTACDVIDSPVNVP
jgi:hypothetical protein